MKNQDTVDEFSNPSSLFIAVLDSFSHPTWIVDSDGQCILNQPAKDLKKSGFDIDIHSHKIKVNGNCTVFHKGKKYDISKKDINHGTNSCLCTIKIEDEAITKLKASSTKLAKVLSAL
jgi:hypothetical protein